MKNIIYNISALTLLATLLAISGGVVEKFSDGDNKITFISVLSTIGAFIAGYFGTGSTLAEISKRFQTGVINDFLDFLLRNYFPLQNPIKDITPSEFDIKIKSLNKEIKKYCEGYINENKTSRIKEILDVPFIPYDKKNNGKTLIKTIYDFHTEQFDGNNTSFIIGEAGSGKSFSTRQIALSFLEKGQIDSKIIVPILIPISSWRKGVKFKSWIVGKVASIYMGNKDIKYIDKLINKPPENYHLIYLFDGLDEIKNEIIEDFFQMVTQFIEANHVIIGTRKEIFKLFTDRDLTENKSNLKHSNCVELTSLDENIITNVFLENLNIKDQELILSNLQRFVLFNTPLLIGILVKVIKSKSDLSELLNSENIKEYVWDEFSEINFKEKVKEEREKFHFTLATLRNYACWMAKREHENFSLDDLQPEVLTGYVQKWTYVILTRTIIGIIISIGIGFTMSGPFDFVPAGLLGGFISSISFLSPLNHWIYSNSKEKIITNIIVFKTVIASSIYFIISLLVFGLYFSVSGHRQEMIQIIAPADFVIGILFAIMFTVLGALRDFRYSLHDDIQLIQKRSVFRLGALDFPSAMIFTVGFGLVAGIICSTLSLLFSNAFPENIFTGWLKGTSSLWKIGVFEMTFIMVIPIAASLGLLIGLNNPRYYKFEENGSSFKEIGLLPHFSVSRTIYSSLIMSILVLIIFAFSGSWISMYVFNTGWEGGNKGIQIGLSAGVFIGLWWGWKDIIKIWVIRIMLFLKGEAPLSFTGLLKDFEGLRFITRIGERYSFLDPSLYKYLQSGGNNYMKPSRNVNWILLLLIFFIALILSLRIYLKDRYYWHSPDEGLSLNCISSSLKPISKTKVLVLNDGKLNIESNGLICVGRILGHVTPLGTAAGFFGMPLNSSFNKLEEYKHGALIYRLKPDDKWHAVYGVSQVKFLENYILSKKFLQTISVNKMDTLEFDLNDKEWQNNSNSFHINLELFSGNDTMPTPTK